METQQVPKRRFDAAVAQKRSYKRLPRKLQVPYSAIGYSISLALQYTRQVTVEINRSTALGSCDRASWAKYEEIGPTRRNN